MKKCIYIFRRDLRLNDNTALIAAAAAHDRILPVFIYDAGQIKARGNDNFLQMQEEALNDLEKYIQKYGGILCRFYGTPYKVVNYLIKIYKPQTVAFNLDYSYYSMERDRKIFETCKLHGVEVLVRHDVCVYKIAESKKCYDRMFGVFAKAVTQLQYVVQRNGSAKYEHLILDKQITRLPVEISLSKSQISLSKSQISPSKSQISSNAPEIPSDKIVKLESPVKTNQPVNAQISSNAPEIPSNKIVKLESPVKTNYPVKSPSKSQISLSKSQISLNKSFKPPITATREFTLKSIRESTNSISCALKLGLVSAREVLQYGVKHQIDKLIRGILWREYYFVIWLTKSNHYDFYDERFKTIEWRNDPIEMRAMWSGRTGVPIIDSCMRELNETGFMWNRGRLLVGFYSVKILRINPFYDGANDSGYFVKLFGETPSNEWNMGGQLYFSKKLIDCCYANNTGNWHWVASDLLDASGQRYGHGWSGRKYNVLENKPDEIEYMKKWPTKKRPQIANIDERWNEWLKFTK